MTKPKRHFSAFNEYPLFASEHMVNSIYDGTRTQFRKSFFFASGHSSPGPWKNPGFVPKELALERREGTTEWWWVGDGETSTRVAAYCPFGCPGSVLYIRETFANIGTPRVPQIVFRDGPSGYGKDYPISWKPNIHMKKIHARLWLFVTDMRAERLHDATEADILKSGFKNRQEFKTHWRRAYFNSAGQWETNPWVWVADFKLHGRVTL